MKKKFIIILVLLCLFTNLKFVYAAGCQQFNDKSTCTVGIERDKDGKFENKYGCVWNDKYEFCSPTGLTFLSCGTGNSSAYDIPEIIPRLTSYFITILKTATPVILIFIGMISLIKAISSQNEDEMKKAKSSLVKKIIAAVMVFLVVSIVQFVTDQVADNSESKSLGACFNCFVNNDCGKVAYFNDGYGTCYNVNTKKEVNCPDGQEIDSSGSDHGSSGSF